MEGRFENLPDEDGEVIYCQSCQYPTQYLWRLERTDCEVERHKKEGYRDDKEYILCDLCYETTPGTYVHYFTYRHPEGLGVMNHVNFVANWIIDQINGRDILELSY